MSDEQFGELLQFFKVLGNEGRLKIVGLLANEEHTVGELAEMLDVKEPTVSHHLATMREMGLVKMRPAGNNRIYSLNTKFLEEMSRDIFAQNNLAALVDTSKLTPEEKVLHTFIQDGRILDLPARDQKRDIVLGWLAEQIDPDRRFTEKELNEVISQYHPDYATMRRYLVDYQYMQRENQVYWRLDT